MDDSCMDGIGANGMHSYRDFGLTFAEAPVLSGPVTKRVLGSVPFSHGELDFTKAYGNPYFEPRELTVVWEVDGHCQREVEMLRSEIDNWLAGIVDEDIEYDVLDGYHLHGTRVSSEPEYDEYGDKLTLTVTFSVYPFQVADEPTTMTLAPGTHAVVNSGWPVPLTARPASASATIKIGNVSQTITGPTTLSVPFETGRNEVTVSKGSVVLTWREERL